jgi:hypothetical protein
MIPQTPVSERELTRDTKGYVGLHRREMPVQGIPVNRGSVQKERRPRRSQSILSKPQAHARAGVARNRTGKEMMFSEVLICFLPDH